jgi:hypothetical protein
VDWIASASPETRAAQAQLEHVQKPARQVDRVLQLERAACSGILIATFSRFV